MLIRARIGNSYRWYYIPISYIPSDNQWQSICVDMWQYLFDTSDEEQSSFSIRRVWFDYPPEGVEFWIDEFRITSSSEPTGIYAT